MKIIIALIVTAAATAAPLTWSADAATQGEAAKAPTFKAHVLTRVELDLLLSQPDKVLVIDVRRPDEISSNGGLPVYLSVQIKDLEKELQWIPKDRTIVTFSNHAARAGKAADVLSSSGFKVAGAAGSETYEKEGGTLTKISIPPPRTTNSAAGP
jgi:rhodanese-related sulfurtransferase